MHTMLPDQTEGEKKAFLGGSKKRIHIVRYPQEHLVVIMEEKISPFVKFEVILHLLTGKLCKAWSSMINLWIDSSTYQK